MNTITQPDLRPGDVLLFHGNGLLSNFIRLFDGSQYSHAAIWDGEHVVEAEAERGEAIRVDDLAASAATAAYAHVYRFVSDDGKQLGPGLPYDPVGKNIDLFKATPEAYAYSQILLLGLLIATRRMPLPGMAQAVRPLMDEAANTLNEWITGGRKVIICSELVYECYLTGDPQYEIAVAGVDPAVFANGLTPREMLMPTSTTETDASHLQKDAAAFLTAFRTVARSPRVPAGSDVDARDGGERQREAARGAGVRDAARPRDVAEPRDGRPAAGRPLAGPNASGRAGEGAAVSALSRRRRCRRGACGRTPAP